MRAEVHIGCVVACELRAEIADKFGRDVVRWFPGKHCGQPPSSAAARGDLVPGRREFGQLTIRR